ncbi:MAG: glycosyltransferase family 2 protein [Candidatus Protochlamydia sp.]|nr:glycosyltransferase family 2 protein [Candidatus Protochlamydia sp.]
MNLFIYFFIAFLQSGFADILEKPTETITISILAKDKAHTLPLFLSCIEKQTWPAEKTHLYIRTNNNNDKTAEILKEWLANVKDRYASFHYDESDVPEQVQKYKQHEWNVERFKVLGKIRQDSLDWARAHHSHYFVADCDNFIKPQTLYEMSNTRLPIVAPLLRAGGTSLYSNYHAAIDENGYYKETPFYHQLLKQDIKGLVIVPVVHCTYFIRNDVLDKLSYNDNTFRYEYVIFSDSARKNNIPQYLDTRVLYGRITFAESKEEFEREPWLHEFEDQAKAPEFNTKT